MKRYFLLILILFVGFTLAAQEENLKPDEAEALIQQYIQEEQDLTAQLDVLKGEISSLEAEIATLDDKIAKLEKKRDELKKKVEAKAYYVVKYGDWLSKLAEYSTVYGHGNFAKWTKIYNANKAKIKDPDLIYPGWKLFIPRP